MTAFDSVLPLSANHHRRSGSFFSVKVGNRKVLHLFPNKRLQILFPDFIYTPGGAKSFKLPILDPSPHGRATDGTNFCGLGCCIEVITHGKKMTSLANAAPRRKRAGYQNGIESDLYLGENVVSPHTPLPHVYPTASGWGIKKSIIKKRKISMLKGSKRHLERC